MPELSRFAGMIIYMLFCDVKQHNKPHVHVYYGEFEAVIGVDGELLAGSLPHKQLKIVTGWLAFHEEDVYKAWNLAVKGEHFEKIPPMQQVSRCIMFIVNGICYANSANESVKVAEVKPLTGRMLLLTFSTGEKHLFDTTTLVGKAFDILDDVNVFNNPSLFHGVVTWDNGNVDIAPETLYQDSIPYNCDT